VHAQEHPLPEREKEAKALPDALFVDFPSRPEGEGADEMRAGCPLSRQSSVYPERDEETL
jgi:hypothetical protein